jgi:hypothetical protein
VVHDGHAVWGRPAADRDAAVHGHRHVDAKPDRDVIANEHVGSDRDEHARGAADRHRDTDSWWSYRNGDPYGVADQHARADQHPVPDGDEHAGGGWWASEPGAEWDDGVCGGGGRGGAESGELDV